MASYNRVVLVGNLTRDVELKYLQSGTAVTEIGLAVNERYKNNAGEWVDAPVFVDVTLWGRTAEVAAEYLCKGAPVLIEGRLKLDQWEDRETGSKRSKLRVVGEKLQMLGRKGDGTGAGNGGQPSRGGARQAGGQPRRRQQQAECQEPDYSPPDDDIPF